MIFDTTNADRIYSKETYLHDDMFHNLTFDRETCKLVVQCFSDEKGFYEIIFHDVIGFEMSSCDYWGPSPHISCFYAVDDNKCILIPKLQREQKKYFTPNDTPIDNKHYIEVELELISGDCLRVACKTVQIEYNHEQLPTQGTLADKSGSSLESVGRKR